MLRAPTPPEAVPKITKPYCETEPSRGELASRYRVSPRVSALVRQFKPLGAPNKRGTTRSQAEDYLSSLSMSSNDRSAAPTPLRTSARA